MGADRDVTRRSGAIILAALLLLAGMVGRAEAQAANALEREVPPSFVFSSFANALEQIGKLTGWKVSCPKDTTATINTIWRTQLFSFIGKEKVQEPMMTVRNYLNFFGGDLGIGWKLDEERGEVVFDYWWRTADPRPAAELLQTMLTEGHAADVERDEKWQHAFNALVCKEGNLEKASLVRQMSVQETRMRFSRVAQKAIITRRVQNTKGEKYVLFAIDQPILWFPGNGSVSYYWFKEDGTLVGCGLMNTGHRCLLVDSTVDREEPAPGEASEIHLILKFNLEGYFIARLVLEPEGLKLIGLIGARGERVDNDGLNIGRSLLPREP
jgi:hypothetical protein